MKCSLYPFPSSSSCLTSICPSQRTSAEWHHQGLYHVPVPRLPNRSPSTGRRDSAFKKSSFGFAQLFVPSCINWFFHYLKETHLIYHIFSRDPDIQVSFHGLDYLL